MTKNESVRQETATATPFALALDQHYHCDLSLPSAISFISCYFSQNPASSQNFSDCVRTNYVSGQSHISGIRCDLH